MAERDSGFLGRWSQRKAKAAQGLPLAEPTPETVEPVSPVADASRPVPQVSDDQTAQEPPAPVLTLEDAHQLTKDSDFKPFMAGNVSADVRNAAMKKLFADPHFNVMDGLDIYIDDYSISDPIPESMLRQMVSAKFLNLFDDEEKSDQNKSEGLALPATGVERDNAENPGAETVAQSKDALPPADHPAARTAAPFEPLSQPASSEAGASHPDHDHTHLRLQPDDAASGQQTGRGAR